MTTLSVLMPAYNAQRFLKEAIESVLQQSYRDFELVIINDGSTDNTLCIAEHYAQRDARIKIITHGNIGMGASLNSALADLDTEWIVRMDADDIMLPNRLERQVDFVEQNPDIAVGSSYVYLIDEKSNVIGKSTSQLITREIVASQILLNEPIGFHHPAVIARRRVILEVGGYRPEFWPADDIDLWNRITEKGYTVLVQPEFLLKYRIHAASVSVAGARKARQKVAWLKSCMAARRGGLEEPTLEGYLQAYRRAPIWKRANQERKDLAKILYKAAAFHYSRRRYLPLITSLAGAVCLQPGYVLRQINTKMGGSGG